MAIVFSGTGTMLSRTANLPSLTAGPWTAMCCIRTTTDTGGYVTVLGNSNGGGYSGVFGWINQGGTGNPHNLYCSGDIEREGGAVTNNTWYHVTYVQESASTVRVYVDGNSTPVVSSTVVSSLAADHMGWGAEFAAATDNLIGEIEAIKVWSVALSTANIASEYQYRDPQTNVGSINYAWRCITATADATTGYNDTSANGRNPTVSGTLTSSGASPAGILGNNPVSFDPAIHTRRNRGLIGL